MSTLILRLKQPRDSTTEDLTPQADILRHSQCQGSPVGKAGSRASLLSCHGNRETSSTSTSTTLSPKTPLSTPSKWSNQSLAYVSLPANLFFENWEPCIRHRGSCARGCLRGRGIFVGRHWSLGHAAMHWRRLGQRKELLTD
jgi:hypothetical protein